MNQLVWFRSDLRVIDNTALSRACAGDDDVIGVYVVTPAQFRDHDMASIRADFTLRNLACLSRALASLDIPLLVETCDDFTQVPALLAGLCQRYQVRTVHANREYEVNEIARDCQVNEVLAGNGTALMLYHDQCILPPGSLKTGQDQPFKVFTPFKRAWMKRLFDAGWTVAPIPTPRQRMVCPAGEIPREIPGWSLVDSSAYRPGEKAALARLADFLEQRCAAYHSDRDFPAIDGTSGLSPYLALGVISPRQCLARLQQQDPHIFERDAGGAATWLNELIWREFYKHVLDAFPRVCKRRAFRIYTEALQWRNDPGELQCWQQGRTGYPIVDAAMRQLVQTGWMHNRLRMIVASFLVKDLLIDWRLGEQFFMQHLIDGDLAANNGGWQWAASTGTDAAPYFRIFNPVNQGSKYDPNGDFIRKFVPELAEIQGKFIHQPWLLPENKRPVDYPPPIVEHSMARSRFLEAFAAIKDVKKDGK